MWVSSSCPNFSNERSEYFLNDKLYIWILSGFVLIFIQKKIDAVIDKFSIMALRSRFFYFTSGSGGVSSWNFLVEFGSSFPLPLSRIFGFELDTTRPVQLSNVHYIKQFKNLNCLFSYCHSNCTNFRRYENLESSSTMKSFSTFECCILHNKT